MDPQVAIVTCATCSRLVERATRTRIGERSTTLSRRSLATLSASSWCATAATLLSAASRRSASSAGLDDGRQASRFSLLVLLASKSFARVLHSVELSVIARASSSPLTEELAPRIDDLEDLAVRIEMMLERNRSLEIGRAHV